jgi:TRAP-type C4-dicarboxylate transport system permease small subunit
MSTPYPPVIPGAAPQQSSKATMAVVLGVLGIVCCGFLAPGAWYLASEEIKAIDAGRIAESNRGMAQVAKILGIIGTILLGLALLWVLFFGGMAVLGALTGGAGM